jgi:hypothetical protein
LGSSTVFCAAFYGRREHGFAQSHARGGFDSSAAPLRFRCCCQVEQQLVHNASTQRDEDVTQYYCNYFLYFYSQHTHGSSWSFMRSIISWDTPGHVASRSIQRPDGRQKRQKNCSSSISRSQFLTASLPLHTLRFVSCNYF